jgi:tetratricopeptide (TPR) repeat protein
MADHLFFNVGDAAGSLPFYEKALSLGHGMKNVGWFSQYISTGDYMGEVVNSYLSALDASGFDDLARRVARVECDRVEYQVWTTHQLESNGDAERAERILVRALERHPGAHSWRFRLGRLEMLRKDFEAAEREFRLAIEYSEAKLTQDSWYSAGLALAFEGQGRLDKAAPLLAKERQSNKPRLLEALMTLHADFGNWREALEAALDAMGDDPEDGYTLEHAAKAYSNLGKIQDAVATYKALIELQPRNGKARLALAEMLVQNGLVTQALSSLDQAIESGSLSLPQQAKANELCSRARCLGSKSSQ